MKTGKRVIGTAAFLFLLVLLVSGLTDILRDKNEAGLVRAFYDEPKNSLDVIVIGSSHAMCGLYPMELYDRFGIVSYDYTSSALVLPQAYYQLTEALRRQDPKLIVMDVSGASYEDVKVGSPEYVHVQFDNMRWSLNKVRAINDLIEDPDDRLEYYFPLLKFHTRWKELKHSDFEPLTSLTKGAVVSDAVLPEVLNYSLVDKSYVTPLSKTAETYLRKSLELCREKDIPVLLLNFPSLTDEYAQGKYNAVYPIAEEYGVPYLNLIYMMEEMGFDPAADFRNETHCNRSGALKVTDLVGRYLKENYDLPDRRDDPSYSYWDEALSAYRAAYPY